MKEAVLIIAILSVAQLVTASLVVAVWKHRERKLRSLTAHRDFLQYEVDEAAKYAANCGFMPQKSVPMHCRVYDLSVAFLAMKAKVLAESRPADPGQRKPHPMMHDTVEGYLQAQQEMRDRASSATPSQSAASGSA